MNSYKMQLCAFGRDLIGWTFRTLISCQYLLLTYFLWVLNQKLASNLWWSYWLTVSLIVHLYLTHNFPQQGSACRYIWSDLNSKLTRTIWTNQYCLITGQSPIFHSSAKLLTITSYWNEWRVGLDSGPVLHWFFHKGSLLFNTYMLPLTQVVTRNMIRYHSYANDT